ncbi:MAG: hypothetical protein ACTSVB_09130 [Candidatus Heimdallarchaeaceae archaeon]
MNINSYIYGSYRILSIFQTIFILAAAVSVLDFTVDFGMNDAFFGSSSSDWWSAIAF